MKNFIKKSIASVITLTVLSTILSGCTAPTDSTSSASTIKVISASENKFMDAKLKEFATSNGIELSIDYKGSVDIMLELQKDSTPYDVVWASSDIWLKLSENKKVKSSESIMQSPVVFGLKKSIAEKLGWTNGSKVSISDIISNVDKLSFRLGMTSASQSNSGLSGLLSFLYAVSGTKDVLTEENLKDENLHKTIKNLLSHINRASESSGWLKDNVVAHYGQYEAMINYESLIIEANEQLVKSGEEPLYAIYPTDGISIANSPIAYIDNGDSTKLAAFDKIKTFLLSKDIQAFIFSSGRRIGLGSDLLATDTSVWNPSWGIDTKKILVPIKTPNSTTIKKVVEFYQTLFKKPGLTVYIIDKSGSMQGNGETQVNEALTTILDQKSASRYFLQAGMKDINIVVPFNSSVIQSSVLQVNGNDQTELNKLLWQVSNTPSDGGTDIYSPVIIAMDMIKKIPDYSQYAISIILMTDGQSNPGTERLSDIAKYGTDFPVYGILFGEADETQMKDIADKTNGRVFDGRKDIVSAFRGAKGNN